MLIALLGCSKMVPCLRFDPTNGTYRLAIACSARTAAIASGSSDDIVAQGNFPGYEALTLDTWVPSGFDAVARCRYQAFFSFDHAK